MLSGLMLISNPVYTAVSLSCALTVFICVRDKRGVLRELSGYLLLFFIMALLNPLFVHRGSTPLFSKRKGNNL